MPTSLSIASGKGGVGKTTLAINLAIMQAKVSNCLLLDADMGMANAHILLGINPELTIKDFFDGSCSLEKVVTNGPEKLKFLSGGSGLTELLNIDKNTPTEKFSDHKTYSVDFNSRLNPCIQAFWSTLGT